MDLASLDLQIQNQIIMYSVPTYPYIKELNHLAQWYDGEEVFHNENRIGWVFDAIRMRRDIEKECLEIRFKNFRYSWYI